MKKFDFSSTKATNNRNRTILTNIVVISGFILLTLLSIIIICIAAKQDKPLEGAKWVFNAIVPLVASWVGAVIAFYFGRDNYEAATENALALNRETLDDINVENIMINFKTIVSQKVDKKDYDKIKLVDLINLYNKIEKDRIPILSLNLRPQFMIHRSTMIEYKQSKGENSEDLTLKDIIEDNPNSFSCDEPKGFITVTKNTHLKDAIEKMNKIKDCEDILITDNGKETGRVLGWLTNSLINRFLNVAQ